MLLGVRGKLACATGFQDGPILQLSALASSKKATVPLREIVPRERGTSVQCVSCRQRSVFNIIDAPEDDEDEDWDQDQEDRELKDDWSLFNAVPEQADEEKEEKPQMYGVWLSSCVGLCVSPGKTCSFKLVLRVGQC